MILLMMSIKRCLFVCILSLFPLCANSQEQKWELAIELEKQDYLIYEDIWLDLTLTNITSDSIRTVGIGTPNHRGFYVVVKDASGAELEYTGPVYGFLSSPGRLIMAGDYEYQSFNLPELFGKSNCEYEYRAPSSYLPAGRYSVQANFDGAVSNIIFFGIVEPSGSELEALKLLDRARAILITGEPIHLGVPIYQELLDKYPNSVYAEKSYKYTLKDSQASRAAIESGTFDWRAYTLDMLEKFPNSGTARGRLQWLIEDLEKESREEVLDEFIQTKPNTRCAKCSRQMLKQIKQKHEFEHKGE